MTEFDEIWRTSVTPALSRVFGESSQATYYDGTGTERGTYDVILGPENAVEKDADSGRRTIYQRTATITLEADSPFTTIATTARLVISENGSDVSYSIAGILSRSASAIVLILQRSGSQRRMASK